MPRSPKHSLNYEVSFENINTGSFFNFNTNIGGYFNFNWQSEFYLDSENFTSMKVPTLYNSGVSISFNNSAKNIGFKILFDIFNIFNERFSLVTDKTGFKQIYQNNGLWDYPTPGRRFNLSLISEF